MIGRKKKKFRMIMRKIKAKCDNQFKEKKINKRK
jgi:hypothetical protein